MSTVEPLSPDVQPDPEQDGINHINVYTRAKTALGQDLSNLAHIPFNHPQHGFFASIEAFWYWAKTGMRHDALRRLYGATAKSAGIRLNPVMMDEEQFKNLIRDAIRLKVVQNRKLCENIRKSTMPFRHYFVYGSAPYVIREPKQHKWQMDCLEETRTLLQAGQHLLLSNGQPAGAVAIREVVVNPTPHEFDL